MKKPRKFPVVRPIGCAREPAEVVFDNEGDDDGQWIRSTWTDLVGHTEVQLAGICDCFNEDGVDKGYLGRGMDREFCWKATIPGDGHELGKLDDIGFGLRWLVIRWRELAHTIVQVARKGGVSENLFEHWHRLRDKLTTDNLVMGKLVAKLPRQWRYFVVPVKQSVESRAGGAGRGEDRERH